jgi:hypothetical protein
MPRDPYCPPKFLTTGKPIYIVMFEFYSRNGVDRNMVYRAVVEDPPFCSTLACDFPPHRLVAVRVHWRRNISGVVLCPLCSIFPTHAQARHEAHKRNTRPPVPLLTTPVPDIPET